MSMPAFAEHGALTTTVRDAWIDSAVQDVVSAGWVDPLSKPVGEMTNLELAQLTSKASQIYLAQANQTSIGTGISTQTSSTASKSLKQLVEEFNQELSAMNVDVAQLEDHLYQQEHLNEKFAALQKQYLKRTGTTLSGYARGYFNTYRGFGPNAIYGAMDQNDSLFGDIILKSIPVPFVMFDADLRLTRTIGLYYADPVQPGYNLRWISLNNTNDVANLTAGDFYRSYTPLTLWNYEVPVYTFVEPTPYHQVRKDIESMVFMDHGPDEHMRGFEATSDQDLGKDIPLDAFHAEVMGGQMQPWFPSNTYSASLTQIGAPATFGSYYAGSEEALDFLENHLEVKGTGLMLWDDNADSAVAYSVFNHTTYVRQYQVGSLSAKADIPFDKGIAFTASAEYAGSYYQDNANNASSTVSDDALMANGDLELDTGHLTVKYIDNGDHFYSPGAQTNRFTPLAQGAYSVLDDGMNGYLNNYVFQNVSNPTLAPYDRMSENILPYGDSTPDRRGLVLGFSADLGQDGWLGLRASFIPGMTEISSNLAGMSIVYGSGSTATTQIFSGAPQTFTGYEGAIISNLSKVVDGLPKTCSVGLDYKHQSTDLGAGGSPFAVDNFIATADVGPFPDLPLIQGMVLSAAYELAQSSGSEYVLNNVAGPNGTTANLQNSQPTLANYVSSFDSTYSSSYTYQPLNITKTSWAFGFKVPLGASFEIHGDLFLNQYTWNDVPGFDRREQIWRLTNEVSF